MRFARKLLTNMFSILRLNGQRPCQFIWDLQQDDAPDEFIQFRGELRLLALLFARDGKVKQMGLFHAEELGLRLSSQFVRRIGVVDDLVVQSGQLVHKAAV